MKILILKIKRRIYYRRLLRQYLKGRQIQKELEDWGCQKINCYNCPLNKESNICGMKNDMFLWSQKMDNILSAYNQCEIKLGFLSKESEPWLIDRININEHGEIVKDDLDNKLYGGVNNGKKVQQEKTQEQSK